MLMGYIAVQAYSRMTSFKYIVMYKYRDRFHGLIAILT